MVTNRWSSIVELLLTFTPLGSGSCIVSVKKNHGGLSRDPKDPVPLVLRMACRSTTRRAGGDGEDVGVVAAP